MRLGGAAIDRLILAGIGVCEGLKQPPPVPSHGPTAKPIIDRCRRAVDRRAILPAAARPQNVDDPADHPPIVGPARSWLVLWEQRFNGSPLPIRQPKFTSHESSPPARFRYESYKDNLLNSLIEFGA